jgi:hypothetical protein
MVLAPNGDLIIANGDAINPDSNNPSEIMEFTQSGQFVTQFSLDSAVDGPFGIALASENGRIRFAAVDDNANTVSIWTLPERQHAVRSLRDRTALGVTCRFIGRATRRRARCTLYLDTVLNVRGYPTD